jgi:hypothetical protein
MSTRPHTVLSWPTGRTPLPLLTLGCVHCDSGIDDRTFRVITNDGLTPNTIVVPCRVRPVLLAGHAGTSSGRRPPLGREHRWPRPWLHQAAARARSLLTRERTSGPARYRRRR